MAAVPRRGGIQKFLVFEGLLASCPCNLGGSGNKEFLAAPGADDVPVDAGIEAISGFFEMDLPCLV